MAVLTRPFTPIVFASGLILSVLLSPARGRCAPPPGAPVVQVVELWEPDADPRAQALTNALREVIYEMDELALDTRSAQLLPTALDAKCDTAPFGAELVESSERGMSKACLERMAKRLGAKAFFWGFFFKGERGRTMVKLHLWQPGGDRAAVLPYDVKNRKRLAERLYRHVVTPGKVGDVQVVAAEASVKGELFVNGRSQGAFDGAALELTVPLGAVKAEVRSGDKVLARGEGTVTATGVASVRLVAEPPPPRPAAPAEPPRAPPSIVVERSSALPWALGGVGVAGVVGAGVLFALRQDIKGGLGDVCRDGKCPSPEDDRIARGELYGALSLLSLGLGIAGLGAATYVFLDEKATAGSASSRRPLIRATAAPLEGGGFVGLSGRF
jgi:hypothetical protein